MKVGHFSHIWYTDVAPELAQAFSNTPVPYDLHITTGQYYIQQVQNAMSAKQIHIAQMHAVQNVGRDIFPFVCVLGPIMQQYDVVCFTHSKKSTHIRSDLGANWRGYLLRNLAGTPDVINTILRKFETNPTLGIVYPETFPAIRGSVEWAKNYTIAKSLMMRMGVSELSTECPEYSAGTMFWVRPKALQKLWKDRKSVV
jgi:O-antigen biosynthesis protein